MIPHNDSHGNMIALDAWRRELKVVYDEEIVGEYDLLSLKEVKKVNFISRLIRSLNYLIWGDV